MKMVATRHALAALRIGFESTLARPRHAMLVVGGLLIASFTLLVVLTIPAGLDRIAGHTGLENIAMVLAGNGMDETDGDIAPELIGRIGALPTVARAADGTPLVAPQFVVTAKMQRRDGAMGTLLVRGVTQDIWRVTGDAVGLAQGSAPAPGLMEIASGRQVVLQYPFTDVGATLGLTKKPLSKWKITGEFSANGGLWESELWADIDNLRGEFNADGQVTSAWVKLESPEAFEAFAASMRHDPRLRGFTVIRQKTFYAQRVGFLANFVRTAAWAVAILLGLMAILAGNSAVGLMLRSRRRELAMLRSIGFGDGGLMAALMIEILLLAVACALVAALAVWFVVNAHEVNSASGSLSIRFALQVTPHIVVLTLAYTMLLGAAGALVPAWQVLRAPLVDALARE